VSDYLSDESGQENCCEETINDLEKKIQQLLIYKREKETIQKQIEEVYKDIDLINEELSTLVGIDDNSVQNDIIDLKEKITKKQSIEETLQKRKEKIERYIVELEKYNEYQILVRQLQSVKDDEKIFERALIKAETMFKLINDAETLSLQNTVDNINIELQEYIISFFGENVSAELITYKEGKDGEKKSSIDVSIIKDGESISLDSLSGGEFDRIALALFLAFNKVSNSRLIILDECLSSLHSELVEEIVEMIKTKLNHKLVLFTLHQANTGMFSEIIDVEQYRCC
jgi:chromosome segregation ATPase